MTGAEAHGIVAGVTELGGKIVSNLPSQFLMLVVLNVIFILGLLLFLHSWESSSMEARERLLTPILTECIKQANNPAGQR